MRRAHITEEKSAHYTPMLLAAGFSVVIVAELPALWKPCEPDWLYLQMTADALAETGWH